MSSKAIRSEYLFPKPMAQAVAMAFWRYLPVLRTRTLVKGGKPLARGFSIMPVR